MSYKMVIHRNITVGLQKGYLVYLTLVLYSTPNEAEMVQGKRGREQTNKRIYQNNFSFGTSLAGVGKKIEMSWPGTPSKDFKGVTGTTFNILAIKMKSMFCVSYSFLGFLENLLQGTW